METEPHNVAPATDVAAAPAAPATTTTTEAVVPSTTSQSNVKPPKKYQSAYFHFMKWKRNQITEDNPDANFGEVTQLATKVWRELTPEEKQVYLDKANEDRARYEKEINEALKQGFDFRSQRKVVDDLESSSTIFPIARIKKVVRLDPEVKHVSGEAFTMVTKAADLFVAYLAEHSLNSSAQRKKKTIDTVDVHTSIYSGPEPLDFLVPDFKNPMVVNHERKKLASAAAKKKAKHEDTQSTSGDLKALMPGQD